MARRSIGEVEATLSADTRKFVAEVKRVTEQAENEEVNIPVEGELDEESMRAAVADAEQMVARAEANLSIEGELDERSVQGAIRDAELMAARSEAELMIEGGLDEESVQAALAHADEMAANADTDVMLGADVDDDEVRSAIAAIRADAEGEDAAVNIGGEKDHDSVEAALALVKQEVAAIDADVNIGGEKDHFDVEAALAQVKQEVAAADADVNIGAEVDTTDVAFTSAARSINSWAGRTGKSAGGNFRGGFMDDIGDDSFWIGIALTIAQPLAEGLEGLLGAATAVVASGITAIGGAAGAAAPLAAGAAFAFGAVAFGIDGVGEALDNVREEDWEALNSSMEDLSPNAREFVSAFAGLKPKIDELKRATQDKLFASLDTELYLMASETIPDVQGAFEEAATSVNEFIRELGAVARETDFTALMESLDPALDNAFDAATNLAGALGPFLFAAAPVAEDFAGWLEDGAAALRDWVIDNPEDIESFLAGGLTSLQGWTDLLGSIVGLFATIFNSGKTSGDNFVTTLDHVIERWDKILESPEGQRSLEDFFGDAEQTLRDMDPFWDGIVEAWGILTGDDTGNFAELMSQLGEAAPAFAEILVALGELELGSALANTIDVLGVFAEIFQSLPDSLQTFIGQVLVTTKVLGPLNAALKAIGVSTPWLAALNIAISAGIAIFDAWGQKEDTARQRTEEFGDSLDFAIAQMVEAQSASSSTAAAMEAFDTAFADATEGSEATTQAMLTLGLTNDELGQSMLNISDSALPAATTELARMASTMIDNEEAAQGLAELVNSTDENFTGLAGKVEEARGRLEQTTGTIIGQVDSWEELAEKSGYSIETILREGLGMKDELAEQFGAIAESTGIPLERLLAVAGGMEEMQDQADDVDFQSVAQEQLTFAATTDEATKAMVEQAAENLNMSGSLDTILASEENLLPLFQEYIRLLYESGAATDEGTSAMEIYSQAQTDAALASQQRALALEEERAAAMRAWQEEKILGEETRAAAAAVAEADFGIPAEFSEGIFSIAENFRQAAQAAEDFADVMEVLRGGVPELESAIAATGQAFRDAAEGVKDMNAEGEETEAILVPALDEVRGSAGELISVFDLASESGAGYSDIAHEMADASLAEAAAMIASGQSAEDTTARMEELRKSLVDQLVAWDVPIGLAQEYADTLLGTPEELTTVINNPTLIDALMNAEDLTVLYDHLGNPVIAEFEAMGIDTALADSEVFRDLVDEISGMEASPEVALQDNATGDLETVQGELETTDETTAEPDVQLVGHVVMIALLAIEQTMLNTLNNTTADPTLKLSDYPGVVDKLDTLQVEVATLELMKADPDVSLDGYATTKANIDTLQAEVAALETMRASPSVSLDNYSTVMNQIDNIQLNLSQISSRTVSVHTNFTSSGVRPGQMTGTIVTEPGLYPLGERGYREAVVPLDLPLSRVDPSVRELAALMRGQGLVTRGKEDGTPRVQVNQVIQPLSADPVDVSIQVVNRIAALIE